MNCIFKKSVFFFFILSIISCNSPGGNTNTILLLKTTLGDIKIKLYDETPIHRDNFIKLVKSGFYEGISFHRVIKNFMIQTGDPATRSNIKSIIPDSLNSYTIPSEFRAQYFHKKGALAAARQGNEVNPHMRSSGTQFYIVKGVILNDDDLNQSEQRINNNIKQNHFINLIKETSDSIIKSGKTPSDAETQEIASVKMFGWLSSFKGYKIPDDQRNIYKTVGGAPFLDQTYTVFGEVIEGLDIVDKISEVQTDSSDKPLNDIKILKIKILNN